MVAPQSDEPPASQGRGWSRARIVFLAVSGAAIGATLFWSREVLLPFVLAVVIAYVLTPAVARLERLRVPRSASILLVYALTLGGLYLSIAGLAPRVYAESTNLVRELPAIGARLSETHGPRVEGWVRGLSPRAEAAVPVGPPPPAFELVRQTDGSYSVSVGAGIEIVQESSKRLRVVPVPPEGSEQFQLQTALDRGIAETVGYAKSNAVELLKVGQQIVARVSRGIFLFFMTLMVAGYLMHTREDVLGFFRSLPPIHARTSWDRLLARIDRGLSGVVRGQLLICLVNGVLSAIGFWMFGLKYWPIIALVAGVGSIIPIFGSILSTIPAVAIGLTQNVWTALWVLLWILGIHQIEANLLNPKIIGTAAKIHPVLVVFSLITGEHFYGLWGALFAVPVLSIAQSIFQHFRYESMPDMPPDSMLPPVPGRGR